MCIELFRHIMTRHKTIRCPSKTIEVGVYLCFFSVDLSHRKAILLRGGPRWKGLGGIITYTSPLIPSFLGASSVFLPPVTGCCCGCGSTAPGSTVVPWASTVVPRGGAVVPLVLTVVLLPWSRTTAAHQASAAPSW